MTREEILKEYTVENGVIRSPGKFEGERVYVPYFWDLVLEGLADKDDDMGLTFVVTEEDLSEFPELPEDGYALGTKLYLYQRDDGFVFRSVAPAQGEPTLDDWAEAIAARIVDEWGGRDILPETMENLKEVLTRALRSVPDEMMKLVGTEIIEETYFDDL